MIGDVRGIGRRLIHDYDRLFDTRNKVKENHREESLSASLSVPRDTAKLSSRDESVSESQEVATVSEGEEVDSIPLNPYEYAKRYKTGFFIMHGPHDPFQAFELAELSGRKDISFEVDGFYGEVNRKKVFVNAHPPVFYEMIGEEFPSTDNLARINPYNYINLLKNSKAPVKFDFKSEEAIDKMAKLAKEIPKERRMGHMFLWELTDPEYLKSIKNPYRRKLIEYENFTLEQMLKAKRELGDVPFVVSARGVTKEKLMNRNYLDYVGNLLKGKAEIVEFNLPGDEAPPPEAVKYLWEKYGVMCEVKIHSLKEKAFWLEFARKEKVPFIGLVDDPALATRAGTPPEKEYERTIEALERGSFKLDPQDEGFIIRH